MLVTAHERREANSVRGDIEYRSSGRSWKGPVLRLCRLLRQRRVRAEGQGRNQGDDSLLAGRRVPVGPEAPARCLELRINVAMTEALWAKAY